MYAPQNILNVWRKFDEFPMERLTKLWFFNQDSRKKQRDVSLMKEHRSQFGITGNCYDLAIWLLDELQKKRITAYPIGHDLNSEDAHVAVIALDESGNRYLCDLGDQWINPILVDTNSENYTEEKLSGFFPGANVQAIPKGQGLEIFYHRSNGKVSKQVYNIIPIDMDYFLRAAEYSQNLINPKPLLECRIPYKNEIAHWEFSNWESFLSTSDGLFVEQKIDTIEKWAFNINEVTGYDMKFLINVLEQYKELS
ncbi:hypothetical protein QGM71_12260 [Virgibacillus sp. C22-A2]|uniref:Uncharacterized protein n=1 Tax=Virgibacillus tibetensis TaxID=3042313 RepID=A0ABU6KGG6_9BACI|nr:hypothetical protein [Virgibacillus sp. C22-A2]